MIFIYIDGNMAICLDRVGVKQDSMFLRDLPDLFYRLNGTDLIVGKHDGDQDGVRPDGLFQFLDLHGPVFIHIQIGDLKAPFLFQILAGVKHRVVLNLAGNNVSPFCLISLRHGFDSPVVRLSAACREVDLIWPGSQALAYDLPCFGNNLLAGRGELIYRGGVAIML